MNDEILRRELRRIAIESQHRCFGCGFEHRCSTHGCAIIRHALERLEGSPNAPLTLEDLQKMDGEPVFVSSALGEEPMWYIVDVEDNELKNPWERISLEGWDSGWPYMACRRPPG